MDAWDAAAPDRSVPAASLDAWDAAAPAGATTEAAQTAAIPSFKNIGMGMLSGAANIGATLLTPIQKAILAEAQQENPNLAPQVPTTRADLRSFFEQQANPKSLSFKGGELGSEVAGTLGVGPALGAAAGAVGAPAAVSAALGSGGLSLGGAKLALPAALGLRAAAGGITGAASAGLVNPEQAAAGGAIGALTPGAAWLAGMMGRGLANTVGLAAKTALGLSTGAGSGAIDAAYRAGAAGDTSFLENMRGDANMADVVDQAKGALAQMRIARGKAYRSGMAEVSGDKTVLDMGPIQDAVANAPSGLFNGKVVNENVVNAIQKIKNKVSEWASSDPSVFHTPEGFDQLKQAIGGIRESTEPGTAARTAADQVYQAVKSQIVGQAPTYARVMSDYEAASTQLTEIQKSLSLGNRASADTALRKLQSVLRNNVNSSFGNRLSSVDALQQQGGESLIPALAGQSLSSWTPRGITGPIEGAAATAAAFAGHPTALLSAPFTSPRLAGEAAYKAGQVAGVAPRVIAPLGNAVPLLANPNVPLGLYSSLLPEKSPATK